MVSHLILMGDKPQKALIYSLLGFTTPFKDIKKSRCGEKTWETVYCMIQNLLFWHQVI